jgi:Arylsulfotransferase (ASST)
MEATHRIRKRSICTLVLLATTLVAGAGAANASAVTISPLNGTPDASPQTQISFLGAPAGQISGVSVVGSRSGSHSGALRSYASATGASFLPARGFTEGERVTATALVGTRGHTQRVGTTFYIARLVDYPLPAGRTPPPATPATNQSFVTQPKLQPPTVHVSVASPAAAPGDILLTANGGRGQNGTMIIDGSGRLVWFQPAAKGNAVTDLQVASYEGKPVLAYWQGHIDLGVGFGSDQLLGANYKPVASIHAGNGYFADLHELQIAPQGSAYISAYTLVRSDLSSVHGSGNGALQDAVVQQIDIKTGLVMFEWHAYGHVALNDSYANDPRDPNRPWDFFHMNSISLDPWGDGNFMISSRNTWAAYEVDHQSGAVLWRLGGKKPSFRMGAGTGTAYQHDARWQPDHTITIFDNGAVPKAHSASRAIHETINWKTRTVSLLSRDVRTPPLLSGSQGDNEVLPNGDWFVGWGEDPYFTEFNAAGQAVFDANLPYPTQVYRAYRSAWSATPAAVPAIALKAAGAATTVYASWNGATGVATWQVLGGATPTTLAPLGSAPSAGFETAIAVPSAAPVFAVQALGPAGEVLGSSHVIKR